MKLRIVVFITCLVAVSCASRTNVSEPVNTGAARPAATAIPTPVVPKNGDYPGKGKVTKINVDMGSVELDHEEIKDVMPAMIMEFYVSDKKLLDGLKIGDNIDFTLRYKDGAETIVDIKKK